MMGTIVLCGKHTLLPEHQAINRMFLDQYSKQSVSIAIVATAAMSDDPSEQIARSAHYLSSLDPSARIEGIMLSEHKSADDRNNASPIAAARIVYLLESDPLYLTNLLRGSEVLAAIAAVGTRGGTIVAFGTSMIALGSLMQWKNKGSNGLGLIANTLILPQHNETDQPLEQIYSSLPNKMTILCIPEDSYCIGQAKIPGDDVIDWDIFGKDPMIIYRDGSITRLIPNQLTSTFGL
jgi:cyanophycinase-like exopeptidase